MSSERHIIIVFIATLSLMISSCDSATTTNSDSLASEYFPMHTGDEWTYVHYIKLSDTTNDTTIVRCDGSLEINNNVYYRFITSFEGTVDSAYYRSLGNRVYMFDSDSEKIEIDFSERYEEFSDKRYFTVIYDSVTVDALAGTFLRCISCTRQDFSFVDIKSYAPNVGLVKRFFNNWTSSLLKARVNGILYN
jgi:hypothetical protein